MPGCLGAAVTQLVAIGLGDAVLTSAPTITYWRLSHKSYTNFALETVILQATSGTAHAGSSNTQFTLDRIGDLVYWMYAIIDICGIGIWDASANDSAGAWVKGAAEPYWTNAIGQAAIANTSFFIGGQCVDEIYSSFLYLWEELSQQPGKKLVEMTGNYVNVSALQIASRQSRRLYTPLPYWFTINSGLALPIVSLQFHSVKVQLSLRERNHLLRLTPEAQDLGYTIQSITKRADENVVSYVIPPQVQGVALSNSDVAAQIMLTYVYLDQRERSTFAEAQFEQVITQHQHQSATINSTGSLITDQHVASDIKYSLDLNFNHTVSELLWAIRLQVHEHTITGDASNAGVADAECRNWQFNDWFNFSGPANVVTGLPTDPVALATLKLNNANRFSNTPGRYFRLVQPWQHHTNVVTATMVYTYSFALQPEDAQASGTANFSRIDKTTLDLTIDKRCFYGWSSVAVPAPIAPQHRIASNQCATLLVFALNWNVLRFKFGLGGVRFAS